MRTIKFKVWDSELKTILPPEEIINLEGSTTKALKEMAPFLTLIQFTGQQDIWEFDICECYSKNGRKFTGEIIMHGWCWCLKFKNPDGEFGYWRMSSFETVEKIGNRFENPDLL